MCRLRDRSVNNIYIFLQNHLLDVWPVALKKIIHLLICPNMTVFKMQGGTEQEICKYSNCRVSLRSGTSNIYRYSQYLIPISTGRRAKNLIVGRGNELAQGQRISVREAGDLFHCSWRSFSVACFRWTSFSCPFGP